MTDRPDDAARLEKARMDYAYMTELEAVISERNRLRATVDALTATKVTYGKFLDLQDARVTELEAQIAALEADKRRLDWLDHAGVFTSPDQSVREFLDGIIPHGWAREISVEKSHSSELSNG